MSEPEVTTRDRWDFSDGSASTAHSRECRCHECRADAAAGGEVAVDADALTGLASFLTALTEATNDTGWQVDDLFVTYGKDGAIVRVHLDAQQKRYVAEIR